MNIFGKKSDQSNHGHSPMKHMLHMILCCGLPVLIILLLPAIAGFSPAIAAGLGLIAPFICPVMMGGMVFMMFRKDKHSCCKEVKTETQDNLPTE